MKMKDEHYVYLGSPKHSKEDKFINLFLVYPYDVCYRIGAAFLPPFRSKDKIYVDLMGPLLALLLLTSFVTYGNSLRVHKIPLTPVEFICLYVFVMPTFSFLISKIGGSDINLIETISVLGYSLYGHLFTLLVSFLCYQEKSNFFFFVCLIVFGGLSTLRIVIILLRSIDVPGARLIVCACVAVLNLLSLIFLHFAYMHRIHVYV